MGKLITLSGIDGSGKSTYCKALLAAFQEREMKVDYFWSRGGHSSLLENLKRVLRKGILGTSYKIPAPYDKKGKKEFFKQRVLRNAWINLILLDWIRQVFLIRFRLLLGTILLCDRYLCDTYVDLKIRFPDAAFEKELLWKLLMSFAPKPDLAYLIEIPAEVSLSRKKDEYPLDVLEQNAKFYRDIAGKFGLISKDGTQDLNSMKREIISEALNILKD